MTVVLAENKPKRRDQLVIMTEIIGIARKGTSKTHIMFRANLSFSQLNQYLTLLLQANLLEKFRNGGKETYKATEKGLEFMERQSQIINLLNCGNHKNSVKTSLEFNVFPRSKAFLT
jgi:predicted transcriptional regulator